jgi:periplasmic protein TonB
MQARFRFTLRAPVAAIALAAALVCPPAMADAQLVSRVEPEFPREASQAGVDKGKVKARMTLDAKGEVVRVEILEATPRRIFDRAVTRTLSQWKFNAGPEGRQAEVEIDFTR